MNPEPVPRVKKMFNYIRQSDYLSMMLNKFCDASKHLNDESDNVDQYPVAYTTQFMLL